MMMPNSMLLPTVASEKSDCDVMSTNLRTEGSGKYSGIALKNHTCRIETSVSFDKTFLHLG